uniref:Uncharacterized protein n=1 Tax=Fagus sylvatica TaxID=28930 RepID=A0A2N9IXT1_FAGSY
MFPMSWPENGGWKEVVRGDRRSASARERTRGAEGGSGWGDSGTSRSAADRWAPWRSAGSAGSARVGRERNRAVEGTGVARGWLGVAGGVAGDSEKVQRAESRE